MELQDMEGKFTETVVTRCPRYGTEATHTLLYKKATCTRVEDVLLHFSCSRESGCEQCMKDYQW